MACRVWWSQSPIPALPLGLHPGPIPAPTMAVSLVPATTTFLTLSSTSVPSLANLRLAKQQQHNKHKALQNELLSYSLLLACLLAV